MADENGKLSPDGLEAALAKLPGWSYDRERAALYRRIQLSNFVDAFGLMTRIAILAECRDHHPEWSNVYNRIDIWLTTHDYSGVSDRDVDLAGAIDQLLGEG